MRWRDRWSILTAATITVGALLWLPYRVGVARTFSDPYLFGFSNRVGLCIVLVFALVAACVGARSPHRGTPVLSGDSLRTRSLRIGLALVLAVSAILFLFTRTLDGTGEAIYRIDRLKLAADGQLPYQDFEFPYGPFLVYGPLALMRRAHLSPPTPMAFSGWR